MRGICPLNKYAETEKIVKLKAVCKRIVKKCMSLLTIWKACANLIAIIVVDCRIEILMEPWKYILLSLYVLILFDLTDFWIFP